MNDIKFKEKLVEFLMELAKPRRFEVAYADGNTIVQEGLTILGLDASDILGFAKPSNEIRIRQVRGSQAWFKNMYSMGWRYVAKFEYEGLSHNGFFVMERELQNKTLDIIREEIEVLLKEDDTYYQAQIDPESLRGSPYIPLADKPKGLAQKKITLTEKGKRTVEALKSMGYKADEINTFPSQVDLEKVINKVREPKEGFESEINDFMIESKKELKTEEELFFDATGKNAVWHGKETKTFKEWKAGIKDAN